MPIQVVYVTYGEHKRLQHDPRPVAMLAHTQGLRTEAEMHRFELEFLPARRRFSTHVASDHDIPALVDLTIRHLPGAAAAAPAIWEVHRKSRSVLAIEAESELVGGFAVLPLNRRGFEALLNDQFSVVDPDMDLMSGETESASALYAWALCVPGPVVGAMGHVMDWLRQPRFIGRDIYACPGSVAGEHFMRKTGFRPIGQTLSGRPLWVYRRRILQNSIQGKRQHVAN
jgi:hypothetical protein